MTSATPAPLRRPGRPRRDGPAMSRKDILRHAFTAFARHGYDGVSLRQLASDCGVSDSLISHHFGSKQQLWYEATDSVFAPLYQQMVDILQSIEAPDVAEKLRRNLRQCLVILAAAPEVIAFLFREGDGEHERARHLRRNYVQPYTGRIQALMEEAFAAGLMRRVSHEAHIAMVFGIMRMIATPSVYGSELAPRLATPDAIATYVDEVVGILHDGLMLATASGPACSRENRS